jgi:hypothetical protein
MPQFPKPPRRPLKIEPTVEAQFERLLQDLERIATGVDAIKDLLTSVIDDDNKVMVWTGDSK